MSHSPTADVNETASQGRADRLFAAYGVCHQNPINKTIHWICVPTIVVTLLGMMWDIPFPQALSATVPWLNWAIVFMATSMLFYLWMSPAIAIGMGLAMIPVIALLTFYESLNISPVWVASLVIFVLAWIGQFIGHKIEGAKPAFFDDLKFLLVGPAWLLGFIYRRLGIPY